MGSRSGRSSCDRIRCCSVRFTFVLALYLRKLGPAETLPSPTNEERLFRRLLSLSYTFRAAAWRPVTPLCSGKYRTELQLRTTYSVSPRWRSESCAPRKNTSGTTAGCSIRNPVFCRLQPRTETCESQRKPLLQLHPHQSILGALLPTCTDTHHHLESRRKKTAR